MTVENGLSAWFWDSPIGINEGLTSLKAKIFSSMQASPSHAAPGLVSDVLFSPLLAANQGNPWARRCPVMSDEAWLQLGVRRVLEQEPSGRGFVQAMCDGGIARLAVSSLFDNLASVRRLHSCRWSAEALRASVDRQRGRFDPLTAYSCLDQFAIFAGDGHYHEKATHDVARWGHATATQHFYALDLRTHSLRHVTAAQTGVTTTATGVTTTCKREHDMHALKRLGSVHLRMGTAKGRKVLHVWDRAVIDLTLWAKWKAGHGIYFISRCKDLLTLTKRGEFPFDATDPVNAGITSDVFVSNGNGSPIRLVTYVCPATGERYQYLTSEHTLPPGIIAYLYKMRWDIEKVFDEVKVKCKENKSWGSSPETKEVQAHFICMAHNLMLLLEDHLATERHIANEHEQKRKMERSDNQGKMAAKAGRSLAPMYHQIQRLSQRCVLFIRWLRNHLRSQSRWETSLTALRHIYRVPVG